MKFRKKNLLYLIIFLFCCNKKISNDKTTTYIGRTGGKKKSVSIINKIQIGKLSRLPYKKKVSRLQAQVRKSKKKMVRSHSNHIFGLKKLENTSKIDLRYFNRIIKLDTINKSITVESSVTIQQILKYLHKHGYILPIIPDMSHLVIGGIISGVGGGSASFKNGFFHDNMLECDVILGNGEIKTCSKNQNTELFYSIPNTLGTIGYITKIKLKIQKSKPYVIAKNHIFDNSSDFFKALERFQKDRSLDFLDGTIFSDRLFVLVTGKMVQERPKKKLDNFINEKIYWKSIQTEKTHCFKLLDYIYRWDTDLYYTSMDEKIPKIINRRSFRRAIIKPLIKPIKKLLSTFIHVNASNIVQDVLIPFSKMRDFYDWYKKKIKLYPIYICPGESLGDKFKFWRKAILCDFGIGYGVTTDHEQEKTRQIEKKMIELGGRKLLYSKHQMTEEEFWEIYDRNTYEKIRKKYGADLKFPDLYDKIKK